MNALSAPAPAVPNASYDETRFNAMRHGLLSRYAVLPWEDRAEYQALLDALVAEHAPQGPTEEHLVEELAGIIWRKRRLQLAEAAIYRERLRKDATNSVDPEQIAGAALLPGDRQAQGQGRHSASTDRDTGGHRPRPPRCETRPGDDLEGVEHSRSGRTRQHTPAPWPR